MKIKLTQTPPLERRHGCLAGRVFETIPAPKPRDAWGGVWIRGDQGKAVKILTYEYEEVSEET